LGERTPCKKLADLRPRQGNLLQRNYFSAVYKTSLHFTKQGGDQLKKILPFFKHASSSIAPKIFMFESPLNKMLLRGCPVMLSKILFFDDISS
jgi:hypothetical protein